MLVVLMTVLVVLMTVLVVLMTVLRGAHNRARAPVFQYFRSFP